MESGAGVISALLAAGTTAGAGAGTAGGAGGGASGSRSDRLAGVSRRAASIGSHAEALAPRRLRAAHNWVAAARASGTAISHTNACRKGPACTLNCTTGVDSRRQGSSSSESRRRSQGNLTFDCSIDR